MEQGQPPGSIKHRQQEGDQHVGREAPSLAKRAVKAVHQSVERYGPSLMPITGDREPYFATQDHARLADTGPRKGNQLRQHDHR